MSLAANITLFLWPLAVVALFATFKPARAVFSAFMIGWLFLPLVSIDMVGLPPYGKFTATSVAIVPCIFLFDARRAFAFRPSWLDVPMLAWCLAPIPTSLTNGLGLWDGLSGMSHHALVFAVPYLVGRLYLTSEENWTILGKTIVLGAICYVPLCLWEMRMSPLLHGQVYGITGRVNREVRSGFGPFQWQPNVFMNSAFEVTMLMSMGALITFWAWRSGRLRQVMHLDIRWLVFGFFVIAVLCKKWSGVGLMLLGLSTLFAIERVRRPALAYLIVLVPVAYMTVFSLNIWRGEGVSEAVAVLSERRAESLQTRIDNDMQLVDRALERPLFGWGGWGRHRVRNERGENISLTDSAFGIYIGIFGILGLTSYTLVYAAPFLGFVRTYPPSAWLAPGVAIAVPFALITGLHLIDNLFNAFPNSMYPMFAGGIATLVRTPMVMPRHIPTTLHPQLATRVQSAPAFGGRL